MSTRNVLPLRIQPVLPFAAALGGQPHHESLPFPLDQPRLVLTYSGTAAVYRAFRALRLPAGATVLCPSYNCGHELEPILRLGLKVRCYRVTSNLETDLHDLERRITADVKAVLVTHFFGFGQSLEALRTLCDRHSLALVEDCAHALLSNNAAGNLGRVGDVAVFSLRKTLPLPNGGAVLFNNPELIPPDDLRPPPAMTTWLKGLDLVKKDVLDAFARERSAVNALKLAGIAPLVIASELIARCYPASSPGCYDPDDDEYDFNSEIMTWGMAPFSQRLMRRLDWAGIASRRRRNYRHLVRELESLAGIEVLRPEIPDHVNPLFLPVLVERRAEVFRHLVRHRIHAAVWWDQKHPAVAWDEFPEANALKDRVLALPVHQDVEPEGVEHLLDVLRACPDLPRG